LGKPHGQIVVPSEEHHHMPDRTPDYQRVVEGITQLIKSGQLKPGDKLPTYAQLADEYKVSVTTTQVALRLLRDRGLVEGHQGKGTYVAESAP
jgi:DNA-binding GntR family transcriptional regulator